ncbi:MAG: sigma-70 family RNA polymerase sigma factor [Bacteroidetes bacterium]|nr:sigma-70 family RNA polymerase sigma factor [Bacteroidota bacterium]
MEQVKTENDEELIIQAKADSQKFAPLYNRYHNTVFRFIFRRVEDFETASDLTSQVFIKAIQNIHQYQFKGFAFSSWLIRIGLNEISMYFRKNKGNRVISIETINAGEIMEALLRDKEDFKILENALAKLKEVELQLIEMRFFEEMSFKSIGEILEITENNAKVKTYRIIDKLKVLFKKLS